MVILETYLLYLEANSAVSCGSVTLGRIMSPL